MLKFASHKCLGFQFFRRVNNLFCDLISFSIILYKFGNIPLTYFTLPFVFIFILGERKKKAHLLGINVNTPINDKERNKIKVDMGK